MVVENDGTVRNSDKNVIQFSYGDDGIDPMHTDHSDAVNLDVLLLKAKALDITHIKDELEAKPEKKEESPKKEAKKAVKKTVKKAVKKVAKKVAKRATKAKKAPASKKTAKKVAKIAGLGKPEGCV